MRAIVATAAIVALPPAARASALPAPITLPGHLVDLEATPDGGALGIGLTSNDANVSVTEAGAGAPAIHRVSADGTVVPGIPTQGINADEDQVALTGDGQALTVSTIFEDHTNTRSHVSVRSLDASGTLGAEEQVSTPGRNALPTSQLSVGPTGAVAFTFSQEQGKRALQRLAFRPAGATRFLPPRTLRPAQIEGGLQVFLGPDGGGVVVASDAGGIGPSRRPILLRRVSPDGNVGPAMPIKVGRHLDGGPVAGAFAGGTFALAAAIERTRPSTNDALIATTLPARSNRPTKVQHLAPGPDGMSGGIALAADRSGTVTLLVPLGSKGLGVFTGRPGRLRNAGRIRARSPEEPRLIAKPDGTATAFWLGAVTRSTDMRLQFAERQSGGTFGNARLVPGFPATPNAGDFGGGSFTLTAPIVLSDGRAAIGYNASADGGVDADAVILATP